MIGRINPHILGWLTCMATKRRLKKPLILQVAEAYGNRTHPACTALLLYFEHVLLASMAHHTLAGQPRTSRRYRTYEPSPLPTMADKLRFILTDVQRTPAKKCKANSLGGANRMPLGGFIAGIRCCTRR